MQDVGCKKTELVGWLVGVSEEGGREVKSDPGLKKRECLSASISCPLDSCLLSAPN